MVLRTAEALPELFEADETAWLEVMADLIRAGDHDQLDYNHLQEFLSDMAKRDKREVLSRLTSLIAHLLKWQHQPENRSGSWQATILEQADELDALLESRTLRNHAQDVLPDAYVKAATRATAETGLPRESFPAECPFTLDGLLSAKGRQPE